MKPTLIGAPLGLPGAAPAGALAAGAAGALAPEAAGAAGLAGAAAGWPPVGAQAPKANERAARIPMPDHCRCRIPLLHMFLCSNHPCPRWGGTRVSSTAPPCVGLGEGGRPRPPNCRTLPTI